MAKAQINLDAVGGGGGNAQYYNETHTDLTVSGWIPDIVFTEGSLVYVYNTTRENDFYAYGVIRNGALKTKYNTSAVVTLTLGADNKITITTSNSTARAETWNILACVAPV